MYYCYDGLLRERPFEIMGYALTIFIIFTHVLVDYFVEGEQGDVGKLVRQGCDMWGNWYGKGVLIEQVVCIIHLQKNFNSQ